MFNGMDMPNMDIKEYLLYMLIMKLLEMKEPENEAPLMFGRRSSTPQAPAVAGLAQMGGISD